MEKNKNRTDLLAAGRKRLQQFRQKKDSKGNKSSAKPSNSELGSDADLASTAKVAVVLSQVPDQDVSSINDTGASNAGSSVPSYEDNMEATNIDVATADPLSSPIIPETAMVTATLAHGVDLLPEDQDSMMSLGKEQDSDPLVSHQVESSIVVEGAGSNYSGNLEYVASELDYSTHSATPNYVDSSDMNFFVDTTKPVAVAVEADCIDRADQGADCLALEQVVKDSEVELENDARLGLSAGGESVETAARKDTGETEMVEPTVGVSKSNNKIDVPASASAIDEVEEVLKREGNLVSALALPQPYGPSIINADIGTPGNSTTDAKSSGCSQSFVPDSHVIERLKEQLYLANCAKDVSLFQLDEQSKLQMEFYQEHQQLFHEVSSASNLVSELRLRNECLCEELVACRSDIQVAVCAKEEIEKQYNAAKAEVVEISMRADELHVELQRSHEALSSQIAEIADCKAFVAALQAEIDSLNGNLTSAVEEKNKVAEEKGFLVLENEKLLTELVECKGSLKSLWVENANLNDILVLASEERKNLEEVKKNIVSENEKLLTDITECKALLEVLQAENSNLKGNLTLVTEERDKFAEEKDHFAIEREKLSLELAVFKNIMAALQMEHCKALDELKEAHSCLEQPSEGNIKLTLPRDGQIELSPPQLEKPDDIIVDGLPVEQLKLDVCDQFLGLVDFNGHLEEAAKIIQKLEDAIQEMHSQSMSSTSSGKVEAPAVSRLIQAFESRVHHDDQDEEEVPSTENIVHIEPILLAKEQTSRLRVVFKELLCNSENAIQLLKGERDRRILADVSLGELKVTYEALKEHSSSCEAASIELDVLYEFIKRHLSNIEAKKGGLMALYDTVRQQRIILEAENNELVQKLGVSQSRIGELERKMDEMILRSDEMVSSVSNQAEDLRKEVAERELKLQQVVQSVRRFDAFVGSSCSTLEIGNDDGLDLGGCVTASVDAATKLIENLQEKLEASRIDHEVMCTSYKEMVEKLSDLHAKNELAIGVLHSLHGKLEKLVVGYSGLVENSQIIEENENLIDPLHLDNYDPLIEQLTVLLSERLQLEAMNYKLNLELIDRTNDVEKLKKREIDSDTILNLVEEVENAIKLECTGFNSDELESRLHSSMSLLFQKYKEADEQLHFSREKNISFEIESSKLQEQIEGLSFLVAQRENESMILKESLRQGTEDFVAIQAELKEKVNDLEQSEQRVSSIREKLSIAVSKGKGLIVQRDNLKQSLAETSNELEKYVQELQVKDSRLQEVETRLKAYSEAGERVEALESELSYIRNSATALRESFLLKDSVLQGIEEILEDLELPENFHSRDIIEKVDWLARSVTGNSLPLTDGDQKSPVGGGSYSDAGFVASDAWKEDMQQNQNTGDDLRKKYEELQSKFYGLAEQNDMLEQSLMERNNVVQRWEEILDRIDMPSQLRSMEPEERIEWLGSALSQAHHHCDYLQQKVDNLETYCATITADLDESQKRLSGIDKALQTAASEKEHLLGDLGSLTRDYDDASKMGVKLEFENDKLQNEITALQEELSEKVKNYDIIQFENDKLQNQVTALQEKFAAKIRDYELIEGEIKRLEDLVSDTLQDNVARDVFNGSSGAECLKQLLQKLVEKYTTLSLQKSIVSESVDEHITEEAGAIFNNEKRDSGDTKEKDAAVLKEELEETLRALMSVKEERDRYMEINQSLTCEVEALDLKRQELQELLSQEEQKSASVREKLNVAVRKGKSLLQQRDTLKLTIEEVSNEVERLKSEIKYRESSLLDYEQKIEDLDTNKERIEVLESEALVLGNRLADTEYSLQERTHTLSMILDTLNGIDAGFNNITDPVEKLNQIAKKWHDLHVSMASSDNSLNKAKRSAELLLAELNEVQERNDGLQEELAQAASELSELSRERDFAEASKHEAISRLEKLSAVHYEERNKQLAELKVAKSCFLQLSESFFDIVDLVSNIFSKDREYLYNLEANMISCLEPSSALDMVGQHTGGPFSAFPANAEYRDKFFATNSLLESKMQERIDDHILAEICGLLGHQLQDFLKEIGVLKEEIYKNSITLDERAKHVSEVAGAVCKEVISQKQSFESMKKNLNRLKHIEKEKDTETDLMRRNISLLHEACSSSVMEIENWKAQFVGSNLTAADLQMNLASFTSVDSLSSEEGIRTMADRLLLVVKDFIHFQAKIVEGGLKDMKATIINLQKELQEKDIQKDRICVELVNQIKEAEAAARSHLQDSQSVKARLSDVERCLEVMEEERNLLKQRVKELEDGESKELDESVRSLNGVLVAKEQEIEALMQALDEEETQMEDLTNKISELERVVQQKNLELENVESSRGKVMKKLSITVCKFDELHHLSASLLSEVEKLQLQVHERDEEISFLRQEVTRCTNDALLASQMNNKRNLNEMHDLVTWLNTVISGVQVDVKQSDDQSWDQVLEYKELLQKQIGAMLSQLEDLRAVVQSKDMLLQVEKAKVEDLMRKGESLENSLREKESQMSRLLASGDSGRMGSTTSEIVEVEPVMNKWPVPGTSIASQVRSLRKVNNDQVAIAIDTESSSRDRLEDEDDDKAHGFKSLTTSKIVPRFTRPVTDMIDGLWVSCDRALMRQPDLRLGVIIYWAIIHALLATFVV